MRVLHVAAEVFPLVKTGGLADVVAALPPALAAQGADVRLLLPGHPPVLDAVCEARPVATLGPVFGAAQVRLLLARMPDSGLPVYVIDAPYLFRRNGGPYQAPDGSEWPDNLQRFGLLGWVAAHLAFGELDPAWVPDVVHAHDWHAGMACAYLAAHPPTTAASVFTVHNLAYQGVFPRDDARLLGLPSRFVQPEGLEFHGQICFMKAGLQYADLVSTVSPSYAREIATPEFGVGLDGVIRHRDGDVRGILNGIDTALWDPARDPALAAPFDADALDGKARCKAAMQAEAGLALRSEAPLTVWTAHGTKALAVDIRPGSAHFGQWVGVELNATNHRQLWIPEGFAHAFLALQDHTHFLYKTTDVYARDCERSIRWDDPAIGIEWPLPPGIAAPIVAAKDPGAPLLAQAELPSAPDARA